MEVEEFLLSIIYSLSCIGCICTACTYSFAKGGISFIEEKQVSMEEAAIIYILQKENGNVSALLEADKESSYGQVIGGVMDMLKGAGVKRLAVAAQ